MLFKPGGSFMESVPTYILHFSTLASAVCVCLSLLALFEQRVKFRSLSKRIDLANEHNKKALRLCQLTYNKFKEVEFLVNEIEDDFYSDREAVSKKESVREEPETDENNIVGARAGRFS